MRFNALFPAGPLAPRFLRRLSGCHHDKGFTLINITGLATGICACIAIYTIASYELSFDNFHPDGNRIYRIGARIAEHDEYFYGEDAPPPAAAALNKEIPGIEASARYYPYPNEKAPNAILTDGNYFHIFPYRWLAGNPATALNNPFSVVLTASQARHYFGPGKPETWINKTVTYEDSLHVHVSGIISDWTGNTDFPFTDLISVSTIKPSFLNTSFHPDSWQVMHGNRWAVTFIKLSPHTDPGKIIKQLDPFIQRHLNDPAIAFFHLAFVLQPLVDIHFNPAYSHDGIRNQLMLRFLTETALIVTLAAIVGIALIRPVFALFQAWLPPDVHFRPFDTLTLGFILILTAITNYHAPPEKLRLFARAAQQLPGIDAATLQGHAPAGQAIIEFPIQLDGRKDKETLVAYQEADPYFISFYHIPLLAGRNFLTGDSTREVMINDTYRRTLGFARPADALGHFVTWIGRIHPIVAVIPDFHSSSFRDPIVPLLLANEPQYQQSVALIIASPIAWLALQHWLREFAFRTTLPWWIFVQAGIAALAIAVSTISIRVLKAALANPSKNLRS